jgi:hypothetical protein
MSYHNSGSINFDRAISNVATEFDSKLCQGLFKNGVPGMVKIGFQFHLHRSGQKRLDESTAMFIVIKICHGSFGLKVLLYFWLIELIDRNKNSFKPNLMDSGP